MLFGSYNDFKTRLRQTFEPPRAEFRARAEHLDLKQGERDLHAYAQHPRSLVSCIVVKPIDEQTQVAVFIKGLTDVPAKDTPVPPGTGYARSSDLCCGTGRLQYETRSYEIVLLSSTETTGNQRSRTYEPLLCQEQETSISGK